VGLPDFSSKSTQKRQNRRREYSCNALVILKSCTLIEIPILGGAEKKAKVIFNFMGDIYGCPLISLQYPPCCLSLITSLTNNLVMFFGRAGPIRFNQARTSKVGMTTPAGGLRRHFNISNEKCLIVNS
jgi:hypothetical protein